ncbi:hypothetical protein DACRYDRAFT_113341 [Dacryopinax primogenitus]|uniref:P/Homo B domain-containing protein n=1 Tax=Dacryopinax primogenitus (strain DJM 731) TaxID=1858805 RepID=M5GA00_DACPD|nr:uncharacterized protein DACRYDRAFT_113341 [Dacryopinax primogenitus]EJU05150.1 hypothetical protein DACRYDRAFT_113341 [Dacryopinax primogenitus]
MLLPSTLIALLLLPSTLAVQPQPRTYDSHDYYVIEHIPSASSSSIHECFQALGVELVEQVGELRDHWLVKVPKRNSLVGRGLEDEDGDNVMQRWGELQRRAKRQGIEARDGSVSDARRIVQAIRSVQPQVPRQRVKRGDPPPPPSLFERQEPHPLLRPEDNVTTAADVAAYLEIADPEFTAQWHLLNAIDPYNTINVTGVWDMDITGHGTRVAVIDDGLDFDSDDLAPNYDPTGSWDFNDHVPEPKPRLSDDRHGTRCTGEIGAARNDVCGVGVAYQTRVSGIRILSGPISDADEATSLNYGFDETGVYSCSWGPPDNGMSMEAPQDLVQKAIINGVQNGRGGKGSIFVFASGNGAGNGDQCNFDGYTNSIFSITVAAVDKNFEHPYYSESCAANLVVAPSSGGGDSIHTTDVGKNKCTASHGGTSAAAPLVAGVMALALDARPELTWRDAQHLIVRTSVHINPDDPDWELTAAGRHYSYKYGYGAIDAYSLVQLAKTWELVKPQAWIDVGEIDMPDAQMDWEGHMSGGTPIGEDGVSSTLSVKREMLEQNNFEKMEHITVRVWINHRKRGDVEVQLRSPNGIVSMLAGKRPKDTDENGYKGWQFSTVKHWDENPIGDWKLIVHDQEDSDNNGSFLGWSMMLWGSVMDPAKAKLWKLPTSVSMDDLEPPETTTTSKQATPTTDPSKTKQLSKPTDHLPGDHTDQTGEADRPAFTPKPPGKPIQSGDDTEVEEPPATSTSSGASSTPTTSLDTGYFDHIRDLLKSSKWLIGTVVIVALFITGAALYYWRRRSRRRAAYKGVAGDEVAMSTMENGNGNGNGNGVGRSKEVYDPFAVTASDEEEEDEADETVALTSGRPRSSRPEVGYHDGFLDDDDPASAAPPRPLYKDEPDDADRAREAASARAEHEHESEEQPKSTTREAGSGDPLV